MEVGKRRQCGRFPRTRSARFPLIAAPSRTAPTQARNHRQHQPTRNSRQLLGNWGRAHPSLRVHRQDADHHYRGGRSRKDRRSEPASPCNRIDGRCRRMLSTEREMRLPGKCEEKASCCRRSHCGPCLSSTFQKVHHDFPPSRVEPASAPGPPVIIVLSSYRRLLHQQSPY